MRRAKQTKYGLPAQGVRALPLYRALTARYLAAPDPAAWSALADLFEEHGEADGALLWRRRADWYGPLQIARVECSATVARTVDLATWHVTFVYRRCDLADYVRVTALGPFPERLDYPPVRVFHVAVKSVSKTYWTERILGVIDHCTAAEQSLARREAARATDEERP